VQRDAEISTRLDQLSVPGRDRRRSGLRSFCEPSFNGNAEARARLVEGLVNAGATAVNNDDVTAQARDEPSYNFHRQLVARPSSFAGDYDTHVQILATILMGSQDIRTLASGSPCSCVPAGHGVN
jgi:hypothetical protein